MCLLIDSTVHLTIQSHNLSLKVQEFLVLVVAFKRSGGMGVVSVGAHSGDWKREIYKKKTEANEKKKKWLFKK